MAFSRMNNYSPAKTIVAAFIIMILVSTPIDAMRPWIAEKSQIGNIPVPPASHSQCSYSSQEIGQCPIIHGSIDHVSAASPHHFSAVEPSSPWKKKESCSREKNVVELGIGRGDCYGCQIERIVGVCVFLFLSIFPLGKKILGVDGEMFYLKRVLGNFSEVTRWVSVAHHIHGLDCICDGFLAVRLWEGYSFYHGLVTA